MQCTNPVRIQVKNKFGRVSPDYPDGLDVPCGKCLGCRIKIRKEWALRMLHELSNHNDSVFVTLTYSDEYLPDNQSLDKKSLQLFFKRLRKDLAFENRSIKYFACGEYGDESKRPHYHMIIFGMGLNDWDKLLVMQNWPFCDWSVKDIADKSFGLAEPDSINYVSAYIDKKFSGDLADSEYKDQGREPVFKLSSQGIGLRFALDNKSQIESQGYITRNGVKNSVPRYYIKKLDIEVNPPDNFDAVEKVTGLYNKYDDVYKTANATDVRSLVSGIKKARTQSKKNMEARVNLKIKKL